MSENRGLFFSGVVAAFAGFLLFAFALPIIAGLFTSTAVTQSVDSLQRWLSLADDFNYVAQAANGQVDVTGNMTVGGTTGITLNSSSACYRAGTAANAGPLLCRAAAETWGMRDSSGTRGINFTLTAAGNQTVAASGGSLILTSPTVGTALNLIQAPILLDTAASAGVRIQDGGAEILAFRDSTNARGINFTLTAAGDQTIAASAGSLMLVFETPAASAFTAISLREAGTEQFALKHEANRSDYVWYASNGTLNFLRFMDVAPASWGRPTTYGRPVFQTDLVVYNTQGDETKAISSSLAAYYFEGRFGDEASIYSPQGEGRVWIASTSATVDGVADRRASLGTDAGTHLELSTPDNTNFIGHPALIVRDGSTINDNKATGSRTIWLLEPLRFKNSLATLASPIISMDDFVSALDIQGGDGTAGGGGTITLYGKNHAVLPNRISFGTPDAAETALVERMRIGGGTAQGSGSISMWEYLALLNAPTGVAGALDQAKLYGGDFAPGDARLYVQSEIGNLVIIGNEEIRAANGLKIMTGGAPAGTDCDAAAEGGRLWTDTTNGIVYVCDQWGSSKGWAVVLDASS
ncbi:MAG: hypothetical protein HY680_11020 [Chloroflexi bacterium]|nr:hypothetical protein [Chloroflexota bacterium]